MELPWGKARVMAHAKKLVVTYIFIHYMDCIIYIIQDFFIVFSGIIVLPNFFSHQTSYSLISTLYHFRFY